MMPHNVIGNDDKRQGHESYAGLFKRWLTEIMYGDVEDEWATIVEEVEG